MKRENENRTDWYSCDTEIPQAHRLSEVKQWGI